MAEYISREAVFRVVHGIARGIATKDTEALKAKDMKTLYKIKGAKEILDSVDTDLCYIPTTDVQPVNQWISVEDRLPNHYEEVLVVSKLENIVYFAWYDADISMFMGHSHMWTTREVTHWMPLPEPPKGGEQND